MTSDDGAHGQLPWFWATIAPTVRGAGTGCGVLRAATVWSVLLRIVLGALLVVHGVAHVDIIRVWGSRSSATSWLFGEAGALGTVLSMLALAGFVLAGLALFAGLVAWRPPRSPPPARRS